MRMKRPLIRTDLQEFLIFFMGIMIGIIVGSLT